MDVWPSGCGLIISDLVYCCKYAKYLWRHLWSRRSRTSTPSNPGQPRVLQKSWVLCPYVQSCLDPPSIAPGCCGPFHWEAKYEVFTELKGDTGEPIHSQRDASHDRRLGFRSSFFKNISTRSQTETLTKLRFRTQDPRLLISQIHHRKGGQTRTTRSGTRVSEL